MRHALHNVEDPTEVKFPTLDALWQYVRANGLCSRDRSAETTKDMESKRARFRSMHSDFIVIPNAWNVGEIRQFETIGSGAIATTSAGLSSSMGRDDLSLSRFG